MNQDFAYLLLKSLAYHWQVVVICLFVMALAFPLEPASAESDAATFRNAHSYFFRLLHPRRSEIDFDYQNTPDQEEEDGPGQFDLQEFSLDGEFPLPFSRDFYGRFGWESSAQMYDFKRVAGSRTALDDDELYKLAGRFGAGIFLNDDWLITGIARLGIFSDFSGGIDEDDFQIYGNGLMVYQINPGTQLVAGVACSEDLDSYPVLPLAGIRILSDEGRVHISITAPLEARFGYNVLPQAQLYLRGALRGEEYQVEGGADVEFTARTEERKFGFGVEYWFGEHFSLRGEGGVLWGGELKFKTQDAGQFEDGDLEPAGYFSAGASFAL